MLLSLVIRGKLKPFYMLERDVTESMSYSWLTDWPRKTSEVKKNSTCFEECGNL
jgi:hypothetical protein